MRTIYGIGETVFDIIFRDNQPRHAVPGGSTFNSLISLGRCGLHPVMVTETGDDHVGRIITDFMTSNGVSTSYVTINSGTRTHISLAFLNEVNDAQYQFYKDHASAQIKPEFPQFQANDIVLFGSFFAVNPVIRDYTREFLRRAYEAGCILYYDVNFRAAHRKDLPAVIGNIEENMRLATIVRGSAEDFECIYGTSAAEEIYLRHIAPLCHNFICTAGAGNVHSFFNNQHQTFEAQQISPISTIGAGDNFNAGIIHHIYCANTSFSDLVHPSADLVSSIIKRGQAFATEVCKSLDNYVSDTFALDFAKS